MKNAMVSLAVASALLNGCYLGPSRSAKRGAYVGNGILATLGVVVIAGTTGGNDCPGGDGAACGAAAGAAAGAAVIGGALVAAALLGVLINAATPTTETTPPKIAPPPLAPIRAKPGAPLTPTLEFTPPGFANIQ